MQAVRFVGVGRSAEIENVPKPSPAPGQVLIKIGGAGVCHSDLHVIDCPAPARGQPRPESIDRFQQRGGLREAAPQRVRHLAYRRSRNGHR